MDPYPEIELARMNDRKRTFYDTRFTMSNTNVYRRNGTFVETRPDSSRQIRSFVFVHVLCLIQVYTLPGLHDGTRSPLPLHRSESGGEVRNDDDVTWFFFDVQYPLATVCNVSTIDVRVHRK